MKRAELKELLRAALYEGPTKQANKQKRRDWKIAHHGDGDDFRGGKRHADPRQSGRYDIASRPDRTQGRADGSPVHTSRSDAGPKKRGVISFPTRSGDPLQHKADIMAGQQYAGGRTTNPKMTARGYQAVTKSAQALAHPRSSVIDTPVTVRGKSGEFEFSPRTAPGAQDTGSVVGQIRAPVGSTPVPDQVKQAASKEAGGRVLFGRYYDGQGNYLGRSQGGKWVDGKSDPNAKTQLEMYNKLMEIRAAKYKSGDKEMVKEMIREIMKSCG